MRNSTSMSSDSSKPSSMPPGPRRMVRTNNDSLRPGRVRDGPIFSDGRTSFPNRKKHPSHEPTGTSQVLTFYPTMAEFQDFPGYIKKIEAAGAHSMSGICKIVPPEGWSPRPTKQNDFKDVDTYMIDSPVREAIYGKNGIYHKTNAVYKKRMSVSEFRTLANSAQYKNPYPALQGMELETEFFSKITEKQPIYGADTEGTIYESQVNEFNMSKLGTILDETKVDGKVIKGVNTVYLYFGMYKTCFPWHAEDMDLYSINYLHFGAPKYWFAISADSADRFEKIMDQYFPEQRKECSSFLRHKRCIVTPEILRTHGIPYATMIQRQNEFIITFPKGYHMGFNTGYNCAESTNFASDRWIDFGKNVTYCTCRKDNVQIDMIPYMRKYRPIEFPWWQTYWYEEAVTVQPKNSSSGKPPKKKKRISGDQFLTVPSLTWKETQGELWVRSRVDLFAEKTENESNGLKYPHCAVCQIFNATRAVEDRELKIPISSDRVISSRPFAKNPLFVVQEAPTTDSLVTCVNCLVTVHPSCYGGEPVYEKWKCFRCRNSSDVAVRASFCNLCEMRAGALLPYKNGTDLGFVHVTCAIFNRRTVFDRVIGPKMCYGYPPPRLAPGKSVTSIINAQYAAAMGEKHESSRFQCDVCKEIKEGLVLCSLCPEDGEESPTLAHATCGMKAGFHFEERNFPFCTAMICSRHTFDDEEKDNETLEPLSTGDEVVVWLEGGDKVGPGKIVKTTVCRYLAVEFLDGSVSKNTPPEDVTACSCKDCDNFYHERGARLRVKWTDERDYDCYYRYAQPSVHEHSVLLYSGEEVTAMRSEIYGPNDTIPSEVSRKIAKMMP